MFGFELDVAIWFILGVILVLLEFVIPGAILSFIGIASILVSGALYFNLIQGLVASLLTWFISSIILVLFLRTYILRFMPADYEVQDTNEENHFVGAIVNVIEDIIPGQSGRISFRDTTWDAFSEKPFAKGDKVKIISRKGSSFQVSSIESEGGL